jgi:serine/threonine protein kinase
MNDLLAEGVVLSRRYKIVRLLGEGDFGRVYQALDIRSTQAPRYVAIKEMPMQMIVDCERQADLSANLLHPTIPRLYGYFSTPTHAYLVKQYIEGANLETLLEQQPGFMEEKRIICWAIQLCDALDFLHHHPYHPIVFRDLKPNNVMVDSSDRVYLVDFELARVFPPGFFSETLPPYKHMRKGLAIGTPGYSPPEQYRGRVTPQSDIYALGATLHHLLTRRDPRKEPPFTFHEHPVRSINPSVSVELENIVMKALNRKMKERFPTAKEMQIALQGCC